MISMKGLDTCAKKTIASLPFATLLPKLMSGEFFVNKASQMSSGK